MRNAERWRARGGYRCPDCRRGVRVVREPRSLVAALAALARIPPREREWWVDWRIVGMSLDAIAARDGAVRAVVSSVCRRVEEQLGGAE